MSLSLQDAYKEKIDVMAVTPHGVKSQIWPGHQAFTISADTHGKAVIDQLGWQKQTRGSMWHALQE